MAVKKADTLIEIKPIEMVRVPIRIVGESPLIVHAWDAKAKREILYKEIFGKSLKERPTKNIYADFAASMYWLTPMPEEFTEQTIAEALKTAKFGFPVTGIKQAAISAAYRMGWAKDKMSMRGAFFIDAEFSGYYGGDLQIDHDRQKIEIVPNQFRPDQLFEIKGDAPVMRDDMVRVGLGSADIRHRGMYENWSANITIKYNQNGQYKLSDIVNIINAGGAVCGIGEWRPERDGQYGMYHVESV